MLHQNSNKQTNKHSKTNKNTLKYENNIKNNNNAIHFDVKTQMIAQTHKQHKQNKQKTTLHLKKRGKNHNIACISMHKVGC
jgi:hypothetical protein